MHRKRQILSSAFILGVALSSSACAPTPEQAAVPAHTAGEVAALRVALASLGISSEQAADYVVVMNTLGTGEVEVSIWRHVEVPPGRKMINAPEGAVTLLINQQGEIVRRTYMH